MSSNTRITPDKVGKIAAKVATETAYVLTGLADVVAGTVQDVVRQGRHSYTERRAAGASPVSDYAKQVPTGAGSVDGMAQDPVATAASNNPLLTTLVAAVSGKVNPQVDLVNTLNSGEFTVFAPVDSAFAKIDAGTMDTLKTNSELLSGILTYHVVAGQLDPSQVVGSHPTVNGASLTVTGSGDTLKVNDANVICGGVKTKNATVYLIDSVLMPPTS